MALFLEIHRGPRDGEKFKIEPGLQIGRTVGEIRLADPKVSGLHAEIEKDENNKLFLVDKGSSNGIRIYERKVMRVAMLPGVSFRIGLSHFKVINLPDDLIVPSREKVSPKPDLTWSQVLRTQRPQVELTDFRHSNAVRAFDPVIELHFLEGIQADSKIVLGYGPRKVGSDVLDIELRDPLAPEIAFEISPDENGLPRFKTGHPDQVRLNNQSVSSDFLQPGDRIQVGTSLIEVHFLT